MRKSTSANGTFAFALSEGCVGVSDGSATHLPNDLNGNQHNLCVSSAFVFRFSAKRLTRWRWTAMVATLSILPEVQSLQRNERRFAEFSAGRKVDGPQELGGYKTQPK